VEEVEEEVVVEAAGASDVADDGSGKQVHSWNQAVLKLKIANSLGGRRSPLRLSDLPNFKRDEQSMDLFTPKDDARR
jgi:hypothetical protein